MFFPTIQLSDLKLVEKSSREWNFELMGSISITLYEVRKNLLFSKLCTEYIQKVFLESFLKRFFNSKIVFSSFSKQRVCLQEGNEIIEIN